MVPYNIIPSFGERSLLFWRFRRRLSKHFSCSHFQAARHQFLYSVPFPFREQAPRLSEKAYSYPLQTTHQQLNLLWHLFAEPSTVYESLSNRHTTGLEDCIHYLSYVWMLKCSRDPILSIKNLYIMAIAAEYGGGQSRFDRVAPTKKHVDYECVLTIEGRKYDLSSWCVPTWSNSESPCLRDYIISSPYVVIPSCVLGLPQGRKLIPAELPFFGNITDWTPLMRSNVSDILLMHTNS